MDGGAFHEYQVVWQPDAVIYKVDGEEMGRVTANVPRDFDAGGMNNVIGVMNISDATSLTVRDIRYAPLGAGGDDSWSTAPEEAWTPDTPAEAAPAALEAAPTPADAPIDWNAIAAQVMANFEATGSWYL